MKDRTRDLRLGTRLALFMQGNNLVDASLAKLVGAAVPTVATWRHGTRPSPHWRALLSKVTGWDWSNLESVAALSDEVALTSRVTTPAQVSTYAYVNPVVAVLLGTTLGGERLTPGLVLASALVLGAVVLLTLPKRWGR